MGLLDLEVAPNQTQRLHHPRLNSLTIVALSPSLECHQLGVFYPERIDIGPKTHVFKPVEHLVQVWHNDQNPGGQYTYLTRSAIKYSEFNNKCYPKLLASTFLFVLSICCLLLQMTIHLLQD